MPKTKKKFIDKKKSVTFQLVHRSQKDPLAADDEAPQRILMPVSGDSVIEHEISSESLQQREQRLSAQRTYGIAFDDDYDYMQHLRQPEKQTAILIPKDPRMVIDEFSDDENEGVAEVLKDGGQSAAIKMPSVVFASKTEEKVGMLHRAIPPTGPQVEWDPDIVAALDEDFDYDDPENIIDDDFIMEATGERDANDNEEYDDEYASDDKDFSGSDAAGSWIDEDDDFADEETRSRFTQYSMSSSVLPRNKHLSLLDDQFEKFYETYDDEKIGDLGQVEIDGAVRVDNIGQEEALKMLLGIKDDKIEKDEKTAVKLPDRGDVEDTGEDSPKESEDEGSDSDDLIKLVKEVPTEKWDCESILSTYSNIYNHPKLIQDPPKTIKLSKKTGIPLDTLPTRGLTTKQLRTLDLENEELDRRLHTTSESSNVTSIASNARQKGETKEEKAARKQAVKEMRRERRAEKKATKVAFRHEKTRQHKELLNMQQNLNGVRIS